MAETPARIVLVRHGATKWSQSGRHTGRTDLPLEPDGESEAIAAGERLADLQPALVLMSPLRRASDSCKLAGFGEAEPTDLLLEMDYGEYEGMTTSEIRESRPAWDLFDDGCPGGESIADVGNRADQLLTRLRHDPVLEGKDVLAFAHGHILRVLAARWLCLPPAAARRFALGSGRLGFLSYEHDWTVVSGWGL
ncbi:MAG: histidine phosphatase family protein [Acidimicrobiales bacterium]